MKMAIPAVGPIIGFFTFLLRRTAVLIAAMFLLSYWLVDYDRMKLKTLNRVVPASVEDLAAFALDPRQENAGTILPKYVLYFKTMSNTVKKSSTAYAMLGYCHYHLGDQNKAAQFYRKAIDINPTFFWFHYNLGLIYFQQGQYAKAQDALQKAAQCRMEDALIFINISKFYKEMNRALSNLDYDTQASLADGYRAVHEVLAKSYYRSKKYHESFVILENSARLGLHTQDVLYYYSGLTALGMKDYEHAAALFQRSIKANPADRDAYYYLGLCLDKMGMKEQADRTGWQSLPVGRDFESFGRKEYDVRIF